MRWLKLQRVVIKTPDNTRISSRAADPSRSRFFWPYDFRLVYNVSRRPLHLPPTQSPQPHDPAPSATQTPPNCRPPRHPPSGAPPNMFHDGHEPPAASELPPVTA